MSREVMHHEKRKASCLPVLQIDTVSSEGNPNYEKHGKPPDQALQGLRSQVYAEEPETHYIE